MFLNLIKIKKKKKHKLATGRTPFFVLIYFVVTMLFVLTLALDIAVLYENDAVLILVLSTKRRYSSFSKKAFVFHKICFKVKVLKTFKIFIDCYIKTCRSLKRRSILKIPSTG